jgi:hypothetical protein
MLALAYCLERMIDGKEVGDRTDAARRLGLTKARITHIADLILLPVEVQERVLGEGLQESERSLRPLIGDAEHWLLVVVPP